MSKVITIVSVLFACILSIAAQTRLTRTVNSIQNAERLTKQQIEFSDPGASGKEITWDFSMLSTLNDKYTVAYLKRSENDSANITQVEHNTKYRYLLQKDTLWLLSYENRTTKMDFVKPEAQLKFPFSYGDSLVSSFEGKGMYSMKDSLKAKGKTIVTVDAYGTLITPDRQTLKNVTRVRRERIYTEIGSDSATLKLDTYSWYKQNGKYPVYETIISYIVSKDTSSVNNKVSFYYQPLTSVLDTNFGFSTPSTDDPDEASKVFTEASLQPNPVVSNLNINYKLTRAATIWFSIHNNAGTPMTQTSPQRKTEGYNYYTINMSAMMTGTYTVYVHVDDMVVKRVVVKE